MSPVEFNEQIDILKQVFGEKSYTPARTAVLFDYVKDCDAKPFAYTVKQWLGDAKTAPLGEQFRDFSRKYRLNNPTKPHDLGHGKAPQCMDCHDTGWVSLLMKEELIPHAEAYNYPTQCSALCVCRTGHSIKNRIEQVSEIRDAARSQLNAMHRAWYDIINRWERPFFKNMPWEEYQKQLDQIGKAV